MENILSLFIKALEDQVLTEEEIKTLTNVLEEKDLQAQDIGFLRNKLADFARLSLAMEDGSPLAILKWLEKTNKLFTRFDKEIAAGDYESKAFFTPKDDCQYEVRGFIQKAKQTLDICVFTISDNKIGNDILFAKNRGVSIRLITDNDTVKNIGSDIQYLYKSGIPIKTDDTINHMHHKFAISDQRGLLTGSYNWTKAAAQHNHENILITSQKALVESYQQEFDKLWAELKTYKP